MSDKFLNFQKNYKIVKFILEIIIIEDYHPVKEKNFFSYGDFVISRTSYMR